MSKEVEDRLLGRTQHAPTRLCSVYHYGTRSKIGIFFPHILFLYQIFLNDLLQKKRNIKIDHYLLWNSAMVEVYEIFLLMFLDSRKRRIATTTNKDWALSEVYKFVK